MPTYDYRCGECGHELELFQSFSESPKRKCPECGRLKLKRVIGTGAGIIFKGSGFYSTDNRASAPSSDGGSSSDGDSSSTSSDNGKSATKSDSTSSKDSASKTEASVD